MNMHRLRPTWYATKKSISLADHFYGKWHRKNTAANAFRHAIWNYLIAKRCLKSIDQSEEVLAWTEKITDLHEDIFPNDEAARAMDLHNNSVGRSIFLKYIDDPEEEIVTLIHELTNNSVMINNPGDLHEIQEDQLVHLENMNA